MKWYLHVLKNYVNFNGRASRPEFWYFVLFNFLFSLGASILDGILGTTNMQAGGIGILGGIYSLAVLLPGIAVGVRRLKDTGRSGWWYLIGLIPIVGFILLIVWWASPGDPQANEYGPVPPNTPEGFQEEVGPIDANL